MIFEIENPFSERLIIISSVKTCLISVPFMLTCIDVRTVKLSPQLNPDWLIQISCASHMQGLKCGINILKECLS